MKNKLRGILLFLLLPVAGFCQDTLSLEKALAIALENNYGIRLAKMESEVANNNNTLGNAGFLPEVTLDASQTYTSSNTFQKFFSGVEKEGNNANSNTFSGKIGLNWTLFDGFRMFINKDRLEVLQKIGELQYRISIENNMADVILAYNELMKQQQYLEVLRQAIVLSDQRLTLTRNKLDLGSGSELNLLQSQVDRNADSSRLLLQTVLLDNLKSDFLVLLGMDPSTPFELKPLMSPPLAYTLDDLTERMKKQNPQLQVALANQEVTRLEKKAAFRGDLPTLNFTGGYSFNRSEYEIGILNYNRNYGPTYGLTATMKLFDGFSQRQEKRNATIQADIAVTETKQLELQLKSALVKTYRSYDASATLLQLEEQNREVASQNLKVATENYKLGGISDIDLRLTQQKFIEAEARLIEARYETHSYEVELLLLTGGLGPTNH